MLLGALVATAVLATRPALAAAAGAGAVDSSFGQGGTVTVPYGSIAEASAVAIQSNGDIVTAGSTTVAGQNEILVTRMTPSGALDPTFGSNGIVTVSVNGGGFCDSGDALKIQPDGKIVVVGAGRTGAGGPLGFAVIRLDTNGDQDATFGHNGIATVSIGSSATASAVAIQPDGKIAVGGVATIDHNEFAAARFNANGTLDQSFGDGGTITVPPAGAVWGMALQADGKMVLAGEAALGDPQTSNAQQMMAVRLTGAGQLDPGFGSGGVVMLPIGSTARGFGVALQPDGKILLTGPAFTTTGVALTVRLNPDGGVDSSFGVAGISAYPDWYGVNGIVLDAQGRIVLPTVGMGVVRLNANGSPDLAFGAGGNTLVKLGSHSGANGAAIQADGKIVLAGSADIGGRGVIMVARVDGGSDGSQTSGADQTDRSASADTSTTGRRASPRPIAKEAKARSRARHAHRRRRRHHRHARVHAQRHKHRRRA